MYKKYGELMKNNPNVVIWGTGKVLRKYIDKIDPSVNVRFFADTYPHKWGTYPAKEINCAFSNIICRSKDEIQSGDAVFIAIEALKDIEAVSAELDEKGISYCHIIEAVNAHMPVYDAKQLERYEKSCKRAEVDYDNKKIVKFINCHVPYSYCNLRCGYCYISQVRDFAHKRNYFHSPKFIRAALSKKRLGGAAFINFCAAGETLMCRELVPIIAEIVKEGHYVSVVTNGTVEKAFDELLASGINMEHLFIKFSFHYLELKRLNLMDVFINNVRKMRSAGCSVTVEITPSDELIPYIDEVKAFSMREFGAYPHVTVARDDTTAEVRVLTGLSLEEYKNTWGSFDSDLFEFKISQVYIKRLEYCMAGEWSLQLNLETGDLYKCIGNPYLDNIYVDLCKEIRFEAVGHNCNLPYCWNCHSYLTLGVIDGFPAPTYYDVRDRKTISGDHWVRGEMAEIFKQKLYENNKQMPVRRTGQNTEGKTCKI